MSKSSLSILVGRGSVAAACFVAASALTSAARADDQPMGKPPAEAKALVDAPKAGEAAPKVETPTDETTATVSAGGQLATGNSQLAAATVNGKFEMRRQENGFAASLLGNYGESAPPGQDLHVTAQNLQGRLRYDRYLIDRLSLFGMATGRYDKLQGLDFRLNLDPGVKYLLVLTDPTQVWVEAGYDYQHDIRSSDVVASTGVPKTQEDHSVRLFAGLKHAFNKEVNVSTGIEFLQSLVDGSRTRLNYDALLAANVGGGFAVGLGFTARYDYSHGGIAGKKDLDTATTFSLIYAFSDAAPPPPPPTCVPAEPPPPPPPPPQSAPPPAPPPPPPANPQ